MVTRKDWLDAINYADRAREEAEASMERTDYGGLEEYEPIAHALMAVEARLAHIARSIELMANL